ncbi:MAG: C39 family peptidase [Chloroflexota bacterium]
MPLTLLSVPHLQQNKNGECVAACSAMALAHIGKIVAYKRLVALLEITEAGTASSKIKNLEQLDVVVVYKQGTFSEIQSRLDSNHPCIVFVQTRELPYWSEDTGHALLVVGLDDDSVYVNDPAFPDAPIQISRGDFDLAWLEFDELYAVLTRRS